MADAVLKLVGITDALNTFCFKGSFKKTNRSRIDSFQELVTKSIKNFEKVSEAFGVQP
jgi:3-deoxy-D-manno-octulosonic acid (KDO) 8-phosphate synthase